VNSKPFIIAVCFGASLAFAMPIGYQTNLLIYGPGRYRLIDFFKVLGRTIITSGTVFLVLIALLVMGGVLLRDFALALLIGLVIGSYSSIFVASAIVWENRGSNDI
jgi:hypothetical protein